MIVLDSAYPVLGCVPGRAAIGKLDRRQREFVGQIAAYQLSLTIIVPAAGHSADAIGPTTVTPTVLLLPLAGVLGVAPEVTQRRYLR